MSTNVVMTYAPMDVCSLWRQIMPHDGPTPITKNWPSVWPDPNYNVRPCDPATRARSILPVLTRDGIRMMEWGIEVGSDSVASIPSIELWSRPVITGLAHSNRCLIPIDGYYENRTVRGRTWYVTSEIDPCTVSHANLHGRHELLLRRPLCIAGVYTDAVERSGLDRFAIITVDAPGEMESLGLERMPAIVKGAERKRWLEGFEEDLLRPTSLEALDHWAVRDAVRYGDRGPELLTPLRQS